MSDPTGDARLSQPLPLYTSTAQVRAAKIIRIDADAAVVTLQLPDLMERPVNVTADFFEGVVDPQSVVGGYYVQEPSGHCRYVPAHAFAEHYVRTR